MRAVSMFGVLGSALAGDVQVRPSIKPSSFATQGATTYFNSNRNRPLLSGKVQFSHLEATPFLGAERPAVGPVRLQGAPAYGQRSNFNPNMGQAAGVVCEKTPDGGAVCSDGTYQTATCGNPQVISGAAPAGSTEKAPASPFSYALPVAIGAGVLGIAAYFFLK